ncbi:MAG: hypothetical protein PVH61_15485 [Candidatus Aminicenantes bacterium]|jgi:hypothetical protein
MSERTLDQPQRANTTESDTKDAVSSQRRDTNQVVQNASRQWQLDTVSGTFSEPRVGFDFSRVPALTGMERKARPLLRTQPVEIKSVPEGIPTSLPGEPPEKELEPKAEIMVCTSGKKSSDNDKSFPSGFGGDKLGPLTDEDDGITWGECVGKVEIVATLPANPASTGWDIKRWVTYADFSNGSSSGSDSREDTSLIYFKDLVPDVDQKIYDIDGPVCPASDKNFPVNHTAETYNNFTQWVTLDEERVSDKVKWYYQARVDDDLDPENKPKNDDTELNDVGTGHITIPGNAHYESR